MKEKTIYLLNNGDKRLILCKAFIGKQLFGVVIMKGNSSDESFRLRIKKTIKEIKISMSYYQNCITLTKTVTDKKRNYPVIEKTITPKELREEFGGFNYLEFRNK